MLDTATGVAGRLHAIFTRSEGRTIARVSQAASPLELRGPIADEQESRFYLRNISCGVFGGDSYDVSLKAQDGARAVVTATSATKIHEMPGPGALTHTRIESSPDAALAYYDGPTILQAGSDLTQHVEIAAGGGLAIYAEVLVWGRIARNEVLAFRHYRSELTVRDECGRALFVERYDLRPDLDAPDLASASLPVLGKVIVAGAISARAEAALAAHASNPDYGYDELPSHAGHVVRVAGNHMEDVANLIASTVFHVVETATEPLAEAR